MYNYIYIYIFRQIRLDWIRFRLDQIRLDWIKPTQIRLEQVRLDIYIDRQIDRWIDRQIDTQIDRQIDEIDQTDFKKMINNEINQEIHK